ncbi:PilT/PilU family type 4a pilus ATPase [bacterium]|nr:PilT/PilU family type 4a pilus ATPase [candidate division CSSED10-310 bacterium]
MARIDTFLKLVVEQRASDLHIMAGSPPIIRVNGDLFRIKFRSISTLDCEMLLDELVPRDMKKAYTHDNRELDFAYDLQGLGRFRVNIYQHKDGLAAAFRLIPKEIKTLEELNLPDSIRRFAFFEKGLILVTGPTGSGKSTTLAAIIDIINRERSMHILTIEDPIEFVHERKRALISQRQIGRHTKDYASAMRAAGRSSADVILIGEMRDQETISMALTCSETGSLVFGTLHTTSAAKAVTRIVDSFPADRQSQVRGMLSMSLRGVISQQLIKTIGGRGRTPVVEILIGTPALSNIIREGKIHMVTSYIETSDPKRTGMQSIDYSLMNLLEQNRITSQTAIAMARDRTRFEQYEERMLLKTLEEEKPRLD